MGGLNMRMQTGQGEWVEVIVLADGTLAQVQANTEKDLNDQERAYLVNLNHQD